MLGTDFVDQLWTPFCRLLYKMERTGMALDIPYCHRQANTARHHEEEAESELRNWSGKDINWRSPQQVDQFVHGDLGLDPSPIMSKGKVKFEYADNGDLLGSSTDKVAIQYLSDHAPDPGTKAGLRNLLKLRQIRSSLKYLEKMPRMAIDGRLHPNIRPDTETNRLAVSKPELQQIPKDKRKDAYFIRRAFTAAPGYELVVADMSQLEMRIQAHLHIKLFGLHTLAEDIAAADCHSVNAVRIYSQIYPDLFSGVEPSKEAFAAHSHPIVRNARDDLKTTIYSIGYGKGAYGLGFTLRDEAGDPIGEQVAAKILDGLFQIHPGIPMYQDWVRDFVKKRHGMYSLLGLWRPLPGAEGNKWHLNRAVRQALNHPMQSGGAEIMLRAMLLLDSDPALSKIGARMVSQVHDELVFEAPVGRGEACLAIMKQHMTRAGRDFNLTVPLEVDGAVAQNWGDAK